MKLNPISERREPIEEFSGEAALRVVVGRLRGPAEGAVEVEVLEPAVEAFLVEDVGAGQPAHVVPLSEPVQADQAVHIRRVGAVRVGAVPVYDELLAEDDEAGQAGRYDVVESVQGRPGGEEAQVVQDSQD